MKFLLNQALSELHGENYTNEESQFPHIDILFDKPRQKNIKSCTSFSTEWNWKKGMEERIPISGNIFHADGNRRNAKTNDKAKNIPINED